MNSCAKSSCVKELGPLEQFNLVKMHSIYSSGSDPYNSYLNLTTSYYVNVFAGELSTSDFDSYSKYEALYWLNDGKVARDSGFIYGRSLWDANLIGL